ncbi:hypothetical protein HQ447_13120 [bacterium]|nr:hypothetical protein [bacterium]
MIRHLVIPWLSGALGLAAAEAPDLLRFANGDQLHGTFQGIKNDSQVVWQRDDLSAAVAFAPAQVRHVVLRGGKPLKALGSFSHLSLVNGDSIAGTITGVDDESMTVETTYAGSLRVPRDQVAMLAPSPLGGRLRYHGPFIENEWKMANASFPEGLPAAAAVPAPRTVVGKPTKDQPGRWTFSGSAWYWANRSSGTALMRENAMPDRSILRFDLAWKNRLSIAIGIHADFTKPQARDKDREDPPPRQQAFAPGDSTILPLLFGNSYVIQMFSTHLMLFRTSVNEEGGPVVERVQINGNAIRLGDTGKARMEIRSSRLTGEISIFINDEFVVHWSEAGSGPQEPGRFAGKGAGLGFVVQTEDSPVKITDVMVAEWNGMPDSARSLQVDDQDVVLLTNGTDRFSGKVGSLRDGKIGLDGKYGKFQFQLDDIAEIRFARNRLAKVSEPPADNLIVRLSPLGQVSGRPLSGNASAIRISNPLYGELDFNLESAVMLDFQPSNNTIDDWDVEF